MVQVEYVLGTTEIIQLLNDPAFYEACPAFLFMQEQGLAASKGYLALMANKQHGASADKLIAPAISSFMRMLRIIVPGHKEQTIALRDFISWKLDYTPERFFVYYTREAGQNARIKF